MFGVEHEEITLLTFTSLKLLYKTKEQTHATNNKCESLTTASNFVLIDQQENKFTWLNDFEN